MTTVTVSTLQATVNRALTCGLYDRGRVERAAVLVALGAVELVALPVDVLVSSGNSATRPLKDATATIPIVMTMSSGPVESGFVASLARPGGNITGLTHISRELIGK